MLGVDKLANDNFSTVLTKNRDYAPLRYKGNARQTNDAPLFDFLGNVTGKW